MTDTPLSQIIAEAGDRLTPAERRIATAVLDDPTLLAFGTVTHLADVVGTSRPSIVRFATKLGFEGFTELQGSVRQSLSADIFRPRDRIRQDDGAATSIEAAIQRSIASVFEAVRGNRLAELAQKVTQAESLWIISGETSRAGAHTLQSGLAMVRPGVHLLDDRNFGSELTDVGPNDLAIVLDFFRYRRSVVGAARILAESGVEIVAITDGPLSPLSALTEWWYELYVPAIGPFDSALPAVALAELLIAEVAAQLQDEATDRFDRTELLWAATDTFHDHPPAP